MILATLVSVIIASLAFSVWAALANIVHRGQAMEFWESILRRPAETCWVLIVASLCFIGIYATVVFGVVQALMVLR